MHSNLIQDLVIIMGLAVGVILLSARLRLPPVLGFLITGAIAGPYGLSLVQEPGEVELIAEIGVILLLFLIGLEFSLKQLLAIRRAVLLGGTLQVVLTLGLVFLISRSLGLAPAPAVFMGFLFALSSTAIVLKLLQERGEINSPQGRITLAILIFQDLVVVPMMLLTPLLAGQTANVWSDLLILVAKGAFVIGFMLVSARYLVPWLLFQVVRTRSRELFVLSVVVICFAVAWLTSSLGLSLALGAFLAGLIISESEYSHQATSNVLPFREVFTSFFFISIGTLLDIQFLLHHFFVILGFTLLTFAGKLTVAALAARVLGYPLRVALLVGLALFQVGEFAFVLSKAGIEFGLLSQEANQYFLVVSILTMAVTPFVIKAAQKLTRLLLSGPWPARLLNERHDQDPDADQEKPEELRDHLVIIGFGVNGKNLAKAARAAQIKYVILELNPMTVRKQRAKGQPILYGDAIHPSILEHVSIQEARVAVIAISDPVATKIIVSNIRRISHKVHLIVRTRFLQEIEENLHLGADEVIPEEFETSIEIFTRVLNRYLVPVDQIEDFTRTIRSDNYEMLRALPDSPTHARVMPLALASVDIASLTVQRSSGSVIDVPLEEAHIRRNYGVTLVAIKRGKEVITQIDPQEKIQPGDELYVLGEPQQIVLFNNELKL